MNEKNYEYLRDQLKFTGFGEGLQQQLKEKMQQGQPSFELFHNVSFGRDRMASVLQFRRSDQQDRYYFNKYLVVLRPENPNNIVEQTFYINKGSPITLKEAYNLVSGRAVNKDLTNREGQVYNAWLQIDFRQTDANRNYKLQQYHQNYGFDLEKALARHPIKELGNEEEKGRLLESLRKGNRQAVTFLLGKDSEVRHFVEARPQFKTVHVYDEHMRRVRQQVRQKEAQGVGQGKSQQVSSSVAGHLQEQAAARQAARKGKSIRP